MKYIAYYRVSTQKQGKSGLGLAAQKTAVKNFLKADDELILEYQEVESGKNNQRKELLKAIEQCKEHQVTLLIAKLDRLSRNAAFIFTLKDAKVDFKCIDMPEANSVTIGIMAVLAQDERERISNRVKVALLELKAKGVKLGTPENLTNKSREISLQVRQKNALENENNKKATALVIPLRNQGKSYGEIAKILNESSFKTRRGKQFTPVAVKRLYDRYIANSEEQTK